jgi:hypothetical protein
LIGQIVEAQVSEHRVEIWVGNTLASKRVSNPPSQGAEPVMKCGYGSSDERSHGKTTDVGIASGLELFPALETYFHFYNHQRPHPGARLSAASRPIPAQIQREEVIP